MKATAVLVGVAYGLVIGSSDCPTQEPPPKPPELKVLERLVGTWDWKVISRPAEWTPKEMQTTGTVTREWVLNGRFVQEKSIDADKREGLVLWTYDSQKKAFRTWHFMSDGFTNDSLGKWDEGSKTLANESDAGPGITATATVHFLDNDTHEWKVIVKDKEGKVYLHMEGTCKRKK
jgi:hypothetical protein